jgi:hypothetical protein
MRIIVDSNWFIKRRGTVAVLAQSADTSLRENEICHVIPDDNESNPSLGKWLYLDISWNE